MCEKLPLCLTLVAIYAVYFSTFLLAGGSKFKEGKVPDWFNAQFEKSLIAKFPGIPLAYWSIAVLECLVPVLLLISIAHKEFMPENGLFFVQLAVAVSSIIFFILGFGLRLVSDFVGAANSFMYFCGTLITQVALKLLF